MNGVVVREAASEADRQACFAIRIEVFVGEQGVPREAELDQHEPAATHLIALADGEPVGTLRWRLLPGGTAKIERVAVRHPARGLGVGRLLLTEALRRIAVTAGVSEAVLHAQTHATVFYERLGFMRDGAPFAEEGIEHVRMRLGRIVTSPR